MITTSADADIRVNHYFKRGSHIRADVQADKWTKESYIEFPLAYYPNYVAMINDQLVPVTRGDNNIVRIPIITDVGIVEVKFKESLGWKISNGISLLTLLSIFICYYRQRQARKNHERVF